MTDAVAQSSWKAFTEDPLGKYETIFCLSNSSSHVNKHKINSWTKCRAEAANVISMMAVFVWSPHQPLYSRLGSSFIFFTLWFSSVLMIQPIKMPISPKLPGKTSPQRWHESKNGNVLRDILSQRAVLRRSFAFRFWAAAQAVFGVIWYSEHNQTEMPGKLRISPLRARRVSGASLPYSLPLSFRLPSWTMCLLCFPSPFHMPLQQTPSPLLSLYIPPRQGVFPQTL